LFTTRNLMITMLLGGIWHGADWKFVAWGALHGAGLVAERLLKPWDGAWARTWWGRAIAIAVVFHLVCLGWVLFRADSFDAVLVYLGALVSPSETAVQTPVVALALLMLGLALQAVPRDMPARVARALAGWPLWAWSAVAGVAVVAVDALGPDGVAPFIYFQF
jgi:D-alanyl-lipoteichoic acid acyltransferase DltB (MBOAT superfamily)